MGLIDLQRQMLALCFDAAPSEATLESLDSNAAQNQREAWLTYREMVRDRLLRELRLALPRTHTLLGEKAFMDAFVHHLSHAPPRTRYFRQVVASFVDSALPLWAADSQLHPASCDLARYELALWEVRDLTAAPDEAVQEFSFERVAVVSRALRLLALQHAVRPGEGLEARPQFLCLQRVPDTSRTKVWRLNATTFQLLTRLSREDSSVSDVVKHTAEITGAQIDAAYLDALCTTLAQFLELGILLGSR
jgi:hypothetical protein